MLNNLSFFINYSKLIISSLAESDKSSLSFIFDITLDLFVGERPNFFKNLTFLELIENSERNSIKSFPDELL